MKLNLEGVATGFEPLPAGEYALRITEGEEREAGETASVPGDPYWNLKLEVVRGEMEGRSIFTNISFTEKALPFAKAFLVATEKWTQAELDSSDFECDVEDVINCVVGAKLSIRETEQYGKTNNVRQWKKESEVKEGASASDPGSLLP